MNRPDVEPDQQAVKEIFADACDMPIPDRARFLEQSCAGNARLRIEVEALLRAHETAGRFLAEPAAAGAKALDTDGDGEPPPDPLPRYVNHFKLVRLLGEGGFGAVYLADQEQPVRRTVALKIIKLGMDTRQVVARFEAERQALAMMDHPNIAKVFDAGATETGRPYFVMELVNGTPITDYCRSRDLPTTERLELFILVCLAVGHAHQKGLIHRDIKPSNVLVCEQDGAARPKVIDFGVAKATRAPLNGATAYTGLRQLIGTLEYMSPEQADLGNPSVDTRSDIYSLGVLLYELLTGVTPFDGKALRNKGYSEAQRILRDVEPQKPSERVTMIAVRPMKGERRTDIALRGDLDWVVMKCLEKDRERRYATAAALAEDLRHYLDAEPVSAGPATATYRLKKLVRKHRAAVAMVAAIAMALVLAVIGTTAGLVHARSALRRAEVAEQTATDQRNAAREAQRRAEQNAARATHEAGRATAVNDLLRGVFSLASPESGAAGQDPNLEDVLRRTASEIDVILRDRPEEEVVARQMLANASRQVFLRPLTAEQLRRAYDISATLPTGPHSPQSLDLAGQWLLAMYCQERGAEAAGAARTILADCRRELGERSPMTWQATLATALCISQAGDADGTYSLLSRLVQTVRPIPAARTPGRLARYLCNLAICLRDRGDYAGATAALREAAALDPPHPVTRPVADYYADDFMGSGWVVRQLVENGDFPDAGPVIERHIAAELARHPRGTPTLAYRVSDLAMLRLRQHDLAGAGAEFRQSIQMSGTLRGRAGETEQDRWRKWTLCCNPSLVDGWRSVALRDQVACALDALLRDYPAPLLVPDDVPVERLRFQLVRWVGPGAANQVVAEGDLDRLKGLTDPTSGVYLLGLEVPRRGDEPLRRANWLLMVPWRLEFHPIVRFDEIRTDNGPHDRDWAAIFASRPYDRRQTLGLAMEDVLALATDPPHRIQWFATRATARVRLPAGPYRFSVCSDDGARVFVDGRPVVDAWRSQPSATADGQIELDGNDHELRVEHFQESGTYTLWLQAAPMTAAAKAAAASMGGGVPEVDSMVTRTDQLISEFPADGSFLPVRAHALARAGRFQPAAREYAHLLAADPTRCVDWHVYAALLAFLDDAGGEYRRACRGIFERFASADDPQSRTRALQACAMSPHLPVPTKELERAAAALAANPGLPAQDRGLVRLACGMAQYRVGHFDLAIVLLRDSLAALPPNIPNCRATAELFCAMALQSLDRADDAQAALARAKTLIQTQVPVAGVDDLNAGSVEQWLTCQTALREASAIIEPRPIAVRPR